MTPRRERGNLAPEQPKHSGVYTSREVLGIPRKARSAFGEAVRSLLEQEQLHLREHCSLSELESYREGNLSSDRQENVREHLAACEDCTVLLLYAEFGPDDSENRSELPEQEIEQAWNRIRPRLEDRPHREGRLLTSLIEEGRLPLGEALPMAREISRALLLLHSAGRTHSDLRAENVLIGHSGDVRLLERGFAPTRESLEIGYGRAAEATVIDLYRSLSPEQIAEKDPDQRSNLFSLGVILYELLTGVSPFRAQTPLETASRILSLEPAPVRELNPAIDIALSNVLVRLLAKEPEKRPEGVATVVHAIESAIDPHGLGGYSSQTEDKIERLYDEIIALVHAQGVNGQPHDEEIKRLYLSLRELQTKAAQEFRMRFDASLAMPIDAGEHILERTRALREELEDLAASDAAPREADPT